MTDGRKLEEGCRCGGIGVCKMHPERYPDGRYVALALAELPPND